jgi:hypothetical protein
MVVKVALTLSGSETLHGSAYAEPPACVISAAVFSAAAPSISSTQTCAWFSAKRTEIDFPIPLAPPVTTATLPFKSNPSKRNPSIAQLFYLSICRRVKKQDRPAFSATSRASTPLLLGLAVIFVVKVPEINIIIHHSDGYDREGEDFRAGLEVAGDDLVGRGKGHMGV